MNRIVLFLITVMSFSLISCSKSDHECYSSVQVTGYYTPRVADYDVAATLTIPVGEILEVHNASFLAIAKIKGAGVTHTGRILEYQSGEWKERRYPLSEAEETWFPRERDYIETRTITTREDKRERTYPKAFVDEAGLEGAGEISSGEVIGWPWDCPTNDGVISYRSAECDARWHVYSAALDATGAPLKRGVIATDKKFFNPASPWTVIIDPVPPGYTSNAFSARDLGPAIVNARIDVYTGHGHQGLKETIALTGDGYRVCFQKTAL